jgi:hypothetical protein
MVALSTLRSAFAGLVLFSATYVIAADLPKPAASSPTTCNVKVDTVHIHIDTEGHVFMAGQVQMGMDGLGIPNGKISAGPRRVHIWRDFSEEDRPYVKKYGLVVGKAYLDIPNQDLQYLCDVDLKLDNSKIAAPFLKK